MLPAPVPDAPEPEPPPLPPAPAAPAPAALPKLALPCGGAPGACGASDGAEGLLNASSLGMVPQKEAQARTLAASRAWRLLQEKSPADGEAREKAQEVCALQLEVQSEWRGRDTQRPE